MDFNLSDDQLAIRAAVEEICARSTTTTGCARIAKAVSRTTSIARSPTPAGSASRCPPTYGGAGLGISEAALMMQTVAATGAGMSGRRRCT